MSRLGFINRISEFGEIKVQQVFRKVIPRSTRHRDFQELGVPSAAALAASFT